jgi:hypothetical protein
VRETLLRFMDAHDITALRTLYDTLVQGLNRSVQFSLFDKHFILNIPRRALPASPVSRPPRPLALTTTTARVQPA